MEADLGLPAISVFLVCALINPAAAQPVTQPFTFSLHSHTLPAVHHGTVAWGDYDGDGDLDAFVSGISGSEIIAQLYRNDGKHPANTSETSDSVSVFTPVGGELVNLAYSRASWGDFDNDGDLDLVVQGSRTSSHPYDPITLLYENAGGELIPVEQADLLAVHSGVLAWADVDNDGDQDLLVTGEDKDGGPRSTLYRNDGGGHFEEFDSSIVGMAYGSAAWSDYDRDGDLDLALSGITEYGFTCVMYRNDNGSLEERASFPAPAAFASLDWGDYDDDGDPDLLLSGGNISPYVLIGETRLLRNDNGSFAAVDVDVAGSFAGSSRWGDYDGDGDLDAFVIGAEDPFGPRTARLYTNEDGVFRLTTYLVGSLYAAADWGDYDGDGDLDLLTAGLTSDGVTVTNLYENRRQVIPPPVAAPGPATADVNPGSVRFRWQPPAHAKAASYNLRVGTAPGAGDVVSPMAQNETGRRLIHRPGNTGSSGGWVLRDLPVGTYYWSVQTVNGAMQASPCSHERTFRVDGVSTSVHGDEFPNAFVVHPNFPNPFRRTTSLSVDIPGPMRLRVQIFDALGNVVVSLLDETRQPGKHVVLWNGRDTAGRVCPSGIYFYRVEAGSELRTGSMIFLP